MAPYCDEQGGAVCNVAISRYATARVAIGTTAGLGPGTDDPLVRAAIRRAGASDVRASVASDFPIGAGLGGSSAAGVALAGALAALKGETLDTIALAERSRRTETEDLGIAGGFQDHYAAAFGGALLLEYHGGVAVERIPLADATCDARARRGLLLYTGESRISASTITAVSDAYRARELKVCAALARMKTLAQQMAASLRAADLDALGEQLGEHWVRQRALHPGITTERIEAIGREAARSGALGMKALGASGGGCVLVIARAGREDELAHALAPLGERLPYTIDRTGFQVIAVIDEHHVGEQP